MAHMVLAAIARIAPDCAAVRTSSMPGRWRRWCRRLLGGVQRWSSFPQLLPSVQNVMAQAAPDGQRHTGTPSLSRAQWRRPALRSLRKVIAPCPATNTAVAHHAHVVVQGVAWSRSATLRGSCDSLLLVVSYTE